MPQINNITIHSFSSEDPKFPAKNLTQTNLTKKWKCEKPGEKSAFVVLKLEKPYQISDINIGNEFSGAIEILVGNSQRDPPQFQELLLASSFMTIIEARSEQNPNRVRMFSKEVFVPSVAAQQWDLVKIVCTQSFNSRLAYGISFINIFTNEDVKPQSYEAEDSPPPTRPKPMLEQQPKAVTLSKPGKPCGKFFFRDSSSEDEDAEASSPFAKWKNKKTSVATPNADTPGTKATMREQLREKLASESRKRSREDTNDDDTMLAKKDRNRSKGLMYDSDDEKPNEKLQRKMDKDRELKEKEKHVPRFSNLNASAFTAAASSSPKSSKFASFIDEGGLTKTLSGSSSSDNRTKTETKSPEEKKKRPTEAAADAPVTKSPEKPIQYKPFGKLMEGVTFVLSGYQNPERGVIRQKALDMGAHYKPDWDSSCTHLICSYSNTPKYHQVKGKGKIVSKKWIESCFVEQKRLPWRRYALTGEERDEPESEDEIICEWHKPKANSDEMNVDLASDDDMLVVDKRSQAKKPSPTKQRKSLPASDSDDDMEIVYKASTTQKNHDNDGDDNDESKNNVIDEDLKENAGDADNQQVQMYSEDSVSSIDITTVECQAFKDKMFYLNGDLSATDRILLSDHIKHMLGVVTKNPFKAHYIIVKQGKSLPPNAPGEVVKEVWVRECFELQAFIPTSRYRLAKS